MLSSSAAVGEATGVVSKSFSTSRSQSCKSVRKSGRRVTAKQLNTKLNDETIARLDHLARVNGRSRSSYASESIRSGLDEMEDWYLAQHRLEEFRQSDDSTIPLGQVDWS